MRRREFILGGAAVAVWPVMARAQQAMPAIGFLRDTTADGSEHMVAGLRKGLSETGYVEGRNVVIEYAWTDGHSDRLPELSADLVRRGVSVVVTSTANVTRAMRAASSTIPIVFAVAVDPVALGLVASINRPGGELTGVSYLTAELGGKRLGLLHELVPNVVDAALLLNQSNPSAPILIRDFEVGARAVGLRNHVLNAVTVADIETAFAIVRQRRIGALLVANDPLFTSNRSQIVALAARHAIPAMYTTREIAEAGGLVSYGSSLPDVYRQVGVYAGRILKGEKPADLPVLQPTKFELVINLKTAKTLGLTVPQTLLASADEVLE
jgi:putative ABC transport system substrate-binding protein